VTAIEHKTLLQTSVGGSAMRMHAQVVAKRQLVGHLRVINSANMNLAGARSIGILAETAWSSRNLGVQTLKPNSYFLPFWSTTLRSNFPGDSS
jgi:hypothetical protein